MSDFDCAVIGSGPGGYVAAIRAAQLGLTTVLIEERDKLGGTCLNIGCIPSKVLLEASEQYYMTKHHSSDFGIVLEPDQVGFDLATMHQRRVTTITELVDGIALLMKKNNVTVKRGHAQLANNQIVVTSEHGTETITADKTIIATGSVPIELPFLTFDGEFVISSTEALALDEVPQSIVIIGAGAIGLELGSVWARLGSTVTIIEMVEHIAPYAEKQLAKALEREMKKLAIEFLLGTKVIQASRTDGKVSLTVEDKKGQSKTIQGDKVLLSIGRKPHTQNLGLETIGIELDQRGFIKVDETFQTSVDSIYAIGDVIEGPMLAHKAEEEGIAVAEHLAGKAGHVNYDAIPSVIYTDPELAQVGKTEDQCKSEGIPVKTGKFYFKVNGRAKSLGKQEGLVKIISHADTDKILGVHILGPRASDLISEAVFAIEFNASAEDIARTSHAHPTLSEVIKEAAMAVDKRQIHG